MEPEFNMPLPLMVFFFTVILAIAYTIKAVVDARVRSKLIASQPSDALIQALLGDEKKQSGRASLRWGVVLSCLAGGFILIEILGWQNAGPGAIGILIGATGIGNLAFYAIERLAA